MSRAVKPTRGLALINALLVVAALSSVAVLLMNRAESARVRQQYVQEFTQAQAYLDGFEDLLRLLLDADRRAGEADHLREGWAQKNYTVPIDRGTASATIHDLQGRFNLSWLAGGDAVFGPETFQILMRNADQPDSLSTAIEQWISEDGPQNLAAYQANRPPLAPRGGPIAMLDELRLVTGMSQEKFIRLQPLLTAVPSEGSININTAPPKVLEALFSGLPSATLGAVLSARSEAPFETPEQVSLWFEQLLSAEDYEAMGVERFTVSSHWFEAEISVTLGQTHLARRVIYQRAGETGKSRVHHRLAVRK